MKESFDSAGFSRVETRLLGLSPSGRRLETNYLRAQPVVWIEENFELDQEQLDQLRTMDPVFLQRIATAVADSWDEGRLVSFYKEIRTKRTADKEKSPKDIIFSQQSTQSQTFGNKPDDPLEQVAIWIRYR